MTRTKKILSILAVIPFLCLGLAGCISPGAPALSLEITSPQDGAELTQSPVTVEGTVSDAEATVTVNGIAAEVDELGNFSVLIELTEGENIISATAILGEEEASASVVVTFVSAA